MKWLLLITLSLYSFIVQSAPCAGDAANLLI